MRRTTSRGPSATTLVLLLLALLIIGPLVMLLVRGEIELPWRGEHVVLALSSEGLEFRSSEPEPVRDTGGVLVPVSAVPVAAYTKLTRDHVWNASRGTVQMVAVPSELVEQGSVLGDWASIRGRVLARDKAAGYAFRESDFLPEGTGDGLPAGIPAGKRALRVDTQAIPGLVMLRPGDHFDLVAALAIDEELAKRAANSSGNAAMEAHLQLEAGFTGLYQQANVRAVVQRGMVVTDLQTRAVPVTVSSLTQGSITRTQPVQEMWIAVEPQEASELAAMIAVNATITCLIRSSLPDDPGAESVTPDFTPRTPMSTESGGYAYIESIAGSDLSMRAVPLSTTPSDQ